MKIGSELMYLSVDITIYWKCISGLYWDGADGIFEKVSKWDEFEMGATD